MNYREGAYGDPASTDAAILFWTVMEQLHYPLAGQAKAHITERQKKEQQIQAMAQMQAKIPGAADTVPGGLGNNRQ